MINLGNFQFNYFEEEDDGTPKLVLFNVPDSCPNVESVCKNLSEKCNIGPLPSYLFGFSIYNNGTVIHLDPSLKYPSATADYPLQEGGEAEYRLQVLPRTIRRLAEISPEALEQFFLSTKYDLMHNRLKCTVEDITKLKLIIHGLMYFDLCRILKKCLRGQSLSMNGERSLIRNLLSENFLHVKILAQYNKLYGVKRKIELDS